MYSSFNCWSDISIAAVFLNVIQILISSFKVSATVYCDTGKKGGHISDEDWVLLVVLNMLLTGLPWTYVSVSHKRN